MIIGIGVDIVDVEPAQHRRGVGIGLQGDRHMDIRQGQPAVIAGGQPDDLSARGGGQGG